MNDEKDINYNKQMMRKPEGIISGKALDHFGEVKSVLSKPRIG